MNDIIFSNSFLFRTITFDHFSCTDNRCGAPSHYFAYMISGKCKIVEDNQTIEIKEGDIFYIPNKCCYRSYWYGEPEIKFISLGFAYFPNFENKKYPSQVIPQTPDALKLMSALAEKKVLSAMDIGTFYTLAGMLIPKMSHVNRCRSKEIVEKTQKYLIEHPLANTGDLAQNCGVSESAVYAAFKKASDTTPNRLRNKILLEKAKELLITTDKSVEHISDSLDFSSSSWFRKKFKEQFGMSPRELRKKYRI